MLQNETPSEWKSECFLYPTEIKKDKYNCEKRVMLDKPTKLELCVQPVEDEATIQEFGLSHNGSVQAVVYDKDVEITSFYILSCNGEKYEIKCIKQYLSYRLIVAERMI